MAPTDRSDRDILTAFFNATGGKNWNNRDNWLSDRPLDDWHGVDANGGPVTGLHLNDNNLTGRIPSDLAGLSRLSWLNLANNRLEGPLPAQLAELGRLQALYVNHNAGLAGELPLELSRLQLGHLAYEGTELHVPNDTAFRRWLLGIENHYGTGLAEVPDRGVPPYNPRDREQMSVRKNAALLTDDQWRRFCNALVQLKHRTVAGSDISIYDQFVAVYLAAEHLVDADGADRPDAAHGGPAFLAWHREYLRCLEVELARVDPDVTLPYWNWGLGEETGDR